MGVIKRYPESDPTVRIYGNAPYRVAVLHGGPGAPGYMAPVARELSVRRGILEPLQSKDSVEGQIDELITQLTQYADFPVTLIGASWGAILALLTAARNEIDIAKLILVGCAVFDAVSSAAIEERRRSRMDEQTLRRYDELKCAMTAAIGEELHQLASQWAEIIHRADSFEPITTESEKFEVQLDINRKVWGEFKILRDTPGLLRDRFSRIDIPVLAIQGDYDPHDISSVRPFLESCLRDVRFVVLPKCGHEPWGERRARDRFYEILNTELA